MKTKPPRAAKAIKPAKPMPAWCQPNDPYASPVQLPPGSGDIPCLIVPTDPATRAAMLEAAAGAIRKAIEEGKLSSPLLARAALRSVSPHLAP